MILLVPIGIPFTYFVLLWRRRDRIRLPVEEREKDEELSGVAFLFDSYKPKFWWFEVLESGRRLALTGALGAVEPGSVLQICTGMLICMLGGVAYSAAKPYANNRDNALQILANFQVFIIMVSSG